MNAPLTTHEAASPAAVLEPISPDESRDLAALEQTIQRGLTSFVEVGEALAEIRDRKLYRLEHRTFESYCREKWKMSPQYATQLCRSASAVIALKSETTGSLPKTERQARPLTRLNTPAEKREAWRAAVAADHAFDHAPMATVERR